jgi:AraC-like DNA-binding protein
MVSMDISTQRSDQNLSSLTLADSLSLALRALATFTPDAPLIPGIPTSPASLENGIVEGEYGEGLHRHPCVEMCFVVEGRCRLWTSDGFWPLSAGQFILIPPGMEHSEGWDDCGAAYRILWMILIGDRSRAAINSYSGEGTWQAEESTAARGVGGETVTQAVADWATSPEKSDLSRACLLRGGALIIVARLLQSAGRGASTGGRHEELLDHVRDYLDLHYADPVTVGSVAGLFHMSPNYLNSLFAKREGMGIYAYLLHRRLNCSNALLKQDRLSVKEVAYHVGFTDPLYFSRAYRRRFGRPPSQH